MNYVFELAKKEEIPEIFSLYKERVQWMEDNGFHQWNETDYLNTYQEPYFEGHVEKERILAAMSGSPSLSRMAREAFCTAIEREVMLSFFQVSLLRRTFLKKWL